MVEVIKIQIGDTVIVESVRSNELDFKKGIGWIAYNVKVKVTRIHEPTFRFDFNGQECFALLENAKKTTQQASLFAPILEAKDSRAYKIARLKEYEY